MPRLNNHREQAHHEQQPRKSHTNVYDLVTSNILQHWIAQLDADNRLILQAASAAQKAVDLITANEKEMAL